ncbi:hypothetical protein BSKO_03416 [Bryopsis sp. KO-2023]|nr:hypothetical protein BSKO_03416 [Bryopsis sp. KO-2023]
MAEKQALWLVALTWISLAGHVHTQSRACRISDTPNILERLDSLGLDSLVTILRALELDSVLQEETATTLFAPSNDAINEFISSSQFDSVDELITNKPVLNQIFSYHFLSGDPKDSGTFLEEPLDTLLKDFSSCGHDQLSFTRQGDLVTVEGGSSSARIIDAGNEACSSYIHVISAVLLPCDTTCGDDTEKVQELIAPYQVLEEQGFSRFLSGLTFEDEITIVSPSGPLFVQLLKGSFKIDFGTDIEEIFDGLLKHHIAIGQGHMNATTLTTAEVNQIYNDSAPCDNGSLMVSIEGSDAVDRGSELKEPNSVTILGPGEEGAEVAVFSSSGCSSTVEAWDFFLTPLPPTLKEIITRSLKEKREQCTSFLDFLKSSESYSIILSLLQIANMTDFSHAQTLFLPDNNAMGRAFSQHDISLQDLTNLTLLTTILDYHVSATHFSLREISEERVIETTLKSSVCQRTSVDVVKEDSYTVLVGGEGSQARIQSDETVCEGTVYVINNILLPCPLPVKESDDPNKGAMPPNSAGPSETGSGAAGSSLHLLCLLGVLVFAEIGLQLFAV